MKKLNHLSMNFFCDIEVDAEDDPKHHTKTWNKKYKNWNVNSKSKKDIISFKVDFFQFFVKR